MNEGQLTLYHAILAIIDNFPMEPPVFLPTFALYRAIGIKGPHPAMLLAGHIMTLHTHCAIGIIKHSVAFEGFVRLQLVCHSISIFQPLGIHRLRLA